MALVIYSGQVVTLNIDINSTIKKLNVSETLATKLKVEKMKNEGKKVYNFGLGESPFPISKSSIASLQNHAHRSEYLPTNGIPSLRKMVSKYYSYHFNYNFHEDRVIIGPGSKELLLNSMIALDAVWMFISPSWVSYEAQAKITTSKYVKVPTSSEGNYRITEKSLRKKFNEIEGDMEGKQFATIINYPNNPTGLTLSNDEVRKIARFARNNEIIILSDEIYANITHPNYKDKHLSFGVEYPEGTIVTGGLSKDRSSGGWRVGVAVMPEGQEDLTKAFKSIGSETYSCVAAPLQYASINAFDPETEVTKDIRDCTSIHSIIGEFVYQSLKQQKYDVPMPEGAFYLMPSLNHMREELEGKGIHTSRDLTDRLLEDGNIAAIPGTAFGLRPDELAFRIAYIDYDGEKMLESFRNNSDDANKDPASFIAENAPSLFTGLKSFGEFIDKIKE